MKNKKIIDKLLSGKPAVVTHDIIQFLKQRGIAYKTICSTFSHNASMLGGSYFVGHDGKRIKSKAIKTEIQLI